MHSNYKLNITQHISLESTASWIGQTIDRTAQETKISSDITSVARFKIPQPGKCIHEHKPRELEKFIYIPWLD